MELSEILYEERFSAGTLIRIMKTILVFLLFCAVSVNVCFYNPAAAAGDASSASTVMTEDAGTEDEYRLELMTAELMNPVMLTAEKGIAVSVIAVSEGTEKLREIAVEAAVPAIPETEEVPALADSLPAAEPIISEIPERVPVIPDESVPEISAGDMENGIADIQEGAETIEPDEPAAVIPPETIPPETVSGVIDGFLVNESGVIYGVADPALAVSDGYMELPAEGCTGIAAGTFADGLPSVREIFIPANITYIEEGAFTGLTNAEWYEMETAGEFYTEEGVLFSDSGTCILAFPAGRTGNYKVPSQVVRFASGAFDGAQLEMIDATECSLADAPSVPDYITLLTRETP